LGFSLVFLSSFYFSPFTFHHSLFNPTFLPQIVVKTPEFLGLFFLGMAKRPEEALAIA
jgi:hypothetical protein